MRARRAVIMAGGRGSRIGGPKAATLLAGRPLIAYPLESARRAGLEPAVVAKATSELPPLDCEVLIEPAEPVHPLAGIVTALEALDEPLVAIACDMPFVPPPLIAALAARGGPLVVPADPRPQPLLARWEPALLPQLRAALTTGQAMKRVVAEIEAEAIAGGELRRFGDPERMFANVNDRGGLERAEASLGSKREPGR